MDDMKLKTIVEIISETDNFNKQIIEFNIDKRILCINILDPIIILFTPLVNNNEFREFSKMCENIKFGIVDIQNFKIYEFFKTHSLTTPINFDRCNMIIYNQGRPIVKLLFSELENMKKAIGDVRKKYNF